MHASARLNFAARQLEWYFIHRGQRFDLPLDLRLGYRMCHVAEARDPGLSPTPACRSARPPGGRSHWRIGERTRAVLAASSNLGWQDTGVRAPLSIAAVQPATVAHDLAGNARAHADSVRAAQARVVVFPELSLTGYELDADAVSPSDPALTPIVEACEAAGSLALVGAPVQDDGGRTFIAMLRVDARGAEVVYRKTWLGDAELGRFSPGDGPTVLEIDGWRLGLGICKDTGAAQHTAGTAAVGVDAYLAGLVHRPEELPEQEARAFVIARTCRAWVVFASFAGPTGDVFAETAGSSAVWSPEGLSLARVGPEAGGIARATIG